MTEGDGFRNDELKRQLRKVLAEETANFIEENREVIVKRAEKRLKEESGADDKETLSELD